MNNQKQKLDQSENFQDYLFTGKQIENQNESENSPSQELVDNMVPVNHHGMIQDDDVNDMTDDNKFEFKQMFDGDEIQTGNTPQQEGF